MSVYHMYIYDGTYHARSKMLFMGLDLLHSQKTINSSRETLPISVFQESECQVKQCWLEQTHNKPCYKLLTFTATDITSLILNESWASEFLYPNFFKKEAWLWQISYQLFKQQSGRAWDSKTEETKSLKGSYIKRHKVFAFIIIVNASSF